MVAATPARVGDVTRHHEDLGGVTRDQTYRDGAVDRLPALLAAGRTDDWRQYADALGRVLSADDADRIASSVRSELDGVAADDGVDRERRETVEECFADWP